MISDTSSYPVQRLNLHNLTYSRYLVIIFYKYFRKVALDLLDLSCNFMIIIYFYK